MWSERYSLLLALEQFDEDYIPVLASVRALFTHVLKYKVDLCCRHLKHLILTFGTVIAATDG